MSTNYSNSLNELIQGVLNHGPDILEHCQHDNSLDIRKYIEHVLSEHLDYPKPKSQINQNNWLLPSEYKDMDIEAFLVDTCPKEHYDRLLTELELYRQHNMMPVLTAMKYVVDTLRENKIVWGVGRGSSVASYVLYLIGVHKIDSIKYKLPIEEFFKEI